MGWIGASRQGPILPNDSIWFPDADELMQSHFATNRSEGQFAISDLGMNPQTDSIKSELLRIPLYATLSALEPEWFAEAHDTLHDGLSRRLPKVQIQSRIRASLSQLIVKYLPRASDDAVLALGKLVSMQLEVLSAQDKELCYDYLYPGDGVSIDISDYFNATEQKKELQVVQQIFETGAVGPQWEIDPARIADLNTKILVATMLEQEADSLMLYVKAAQSPESLSKEQICDLSVMTSAQINSLPDDDAIYLLRVGITLEAQTHAQ